MTEERLSQDESAAAAHAATILKMLIALDIPKDPQSVPEWRGKIKQFREILLEFWEKDKTGMLMIQFLKILYNVIAVNSRHISPAIWNVLDIVDESKINEIVENLLSDSDNNQDAKIQNALTAIVDGLCQCGPQTPRLLVWALAIVKSLETRKNYNVLINVAENVILTLTHCMYLPAFRHLVYPLLKTFLFPVSTPHVFYKVIDEVPKLLSTLLKDTEDEQTQSYLSELSILLNILMERFPNKTYQQKYNLIKLVIAKCPEGDFESETLTVWDWSYVTHQRHPNKLTTYKGLTNLGNTCFMNSVLQLLYMCARFRQELLDKEIVNSDNDCFGDLQLLFALMRETDRPVVTPAKLLMSSLPATFRRGHQHDASEYLIYLLENLHENENKLIRRSKQVRNNEILEEAAACVKPTPSDNEEKTLVDRLFSCESLSVTTCCLCKKSYPKKETFRDLPLSFPDHSKTWDLQELLDVYLKPELLTNENMYDCEGCGVKREATKTQIITTAPQHLILTMKLFRFDPVHKQSLKLHGKLRNVKNVELPVYISSHTTPTFVLYELKGAVLHVGSSLDGGHYFTSARDQNGQWYILNDSVVSPSSSAWTGSNGTLYILLFGRSDLQDPVYKPLSPVLQTYVSRDNERFLSEERYNDKNKSLLSGSGRRRNDDDCDDEDSYNGGQGQGPSLVF